MKELSNIIETLNVFESFKSKQLRELLSTLKVTVNAVGTVYASTGQTGYKGRGNFVLPRGIAWDKIEDSDIFMGDNTDNNFVKKFIKSENYIVLWFPLMTRIVHQTRNMSWRIKPGCTLITIGKKFVENCPGIRRWEIANTVHTEEFFASSKGEKVIQDRDNLIKALHEPKLLTPSVKDWVGPEDGHATVDRMISTCIATCVAIPRDVIAKYSTLELLQKRFDSKIGATALMRTKLSEWDILQRTMSPDAFKKLERDLSYSQIAALKIDTKKNIVDYPEILSNNKTRYSSVEMSEAVAISILKKYVPRVKALQQEYQDAEEYMIKNRRRTVPENINSLGVEDFVDVYFNTTSGSILELNNKYSGFDMWMKEVMKYAERIARLIKDYKKEIADLYGTKDVAIRNANTRTRKSLATAEENLLNAINNAERASKEFNSIKLIYEKEA